MQASTGGYEEQGSARQQGGKDKSFQGCYGVFTVLTQDHRRSLDSTEAKPYKRRSVIILSCSDFLGGSAV